MFRKAFLVVGLIVVQHSTLGQYNNKLLNRTIDSLAQNIDTFFVYRQPDSQIPALDDTLYSSDNQFLFWNDKGQCFRQRFAGCVSIDGVRYFDTSFHIVRTGELESFQYFRNNITRLCNEKMKPAIIEDIPGDITSRHLFHSSHSFMTGVTIFVKRQRTDNYYSEDQIFDGAIYDQNGLVKRKFKMVNYEENVNTAIFHLTTYLSKEIN